MRYWMKEGSKSKNKVLEWMANKICNWSHEQKKRKSFNWLWVNQSICWMTLQQHYSTGTSNRICNRFSIWSQKNAMQQENHVRATILNFTSNYNSKVIWVQTIDELIHRERSYWQNNTVNHETVYILKPVQYDWIM